MSVNGVPGPSIACANPTCRLVCAVHPATKAAIEAGRRDVIDQFCRSTGFKLIIDGGEPRLFCERCAF
jgi:hypothetical protein